jgi:hypothetical protein
VHALFLAAILLFTGFTRTLPTGDWSLTGSILTFAIPVGLFIIVATILYFQFTRPHAVPGHRDLVPAMAGGGAAALGRHAAGTPRHAAGSQPPAGGQPPASGPGQPPAGGQNPGDGTEGRE